MKLIIVGSGNSFAIENYYAKYLADEGWDILRFNAADIFSAYYSGGALNKVAFRLGMSGIYQRINEDLLKFSEKSAPDAIWIFKGMEIFPETIQSLQMAGIYLANYNPDNPFIFTGKGSGNSNITKSVTLYDVHFTYNREVELRLKALDRGKVEYLPFGYELSVADFEHCARLEESLTPAFVGNPDPQRAEFLRSLDLRDVRMQLYGNGWDKFVDRSMFDIHPEVRGLDFWKALRRHRVQLNIVRIHNEDSHNMRSFEVPAVGGIMLAKNTPEHREFFDNGEEVVLYDDAEDCSAKIQELLSLAKERAEQIRSAARLRSLVSGYSYRDRAMQVSRVLKDSIASNKRSCV